MKSGFRLLQGLAIFASLAGAAAPSHAQDATANNVHWAYSAYFGSGWYRVADDRDVFVIRVAPRWQMREASYAENDERTIGIEFRLAVTGGLNNFSVDDIPGAIDLDNVASLSVTPGVDVTVPVSERWTLRPFAAIGYGRALDGSESAWTYWAGINSRYTLSQGKFRWALVNSMAYVGNSPSIGDEDHFWPLMLGLELDYPLGDRKWDNEQVYLAWHGLYSWFADDLDQARSDNQVEPITDQWEFGLALRKESGPIRIGFMKFDRLGLGYRFSSAGDLEGVSFIFRSVFER